MAMVNLRDLDRMNQGAKRMIRLITGEKTGTDPDIATTCSATIDGMIRMQKELRTMLEALPVYEERMVITLHFLKGFTVQETADAMNFSLRSAYYFLKHGKIHLMELFPDKICFT